MDGISFAEAFDSTEESEPVDSRLMDVVNSYMGVPYHRGGTTRRGMDCSGFVTAVYRDVYQLPLPRSSSDMFTIGRGVSSIDKARPGDLVFFHGRRRVVNHVGIYVGDGKFAHASSTLGVTITAMDADYFGTHFSGIRRVVRD
jgi:cell wall-associated NlpC family hydrolase